MGVEECCGGKLEIRGAQSIYRNEDVLNPGCFFEALENLTEGVGECVGCNAGEDERDGVSLREVREHFVLERISGRGFEAREGEDWAVLGEVAHAERALSVLPDEESIGECTQGFSFLFESLECLECAMGEIGSSFAGFF